MITLPDHLGTALIVIRALDDLGVASTVGGSIAASFAGEPRSTIDVDIVAAIDERHVQPLAAALQDEFYVDPDALRRAVATRSAVGAVASAPTASGATCSASSACRASGSTSTTCARTPRPSAWRISCRGLSGLHSRPADGAHGGGHAARRQGGRRPSGYMP